MKAPIARLIEMRQQAITYMLSEIGHICHHMKPREPGSTGERETGLYMAGKLKNECGCSDVKVETFTEHPSSFYGYCVMSGILDTMSSVGLFVHPLVSIVSGSLSMFLFAVFFVLYKPIIDWMFPERQGTNVTAVRHCKGELKRRILFSGHMDASWEFTLNYYCGGIVFEIPNVMALIGVLFDIVIAAFSLAGAGWTASAAIWSLFFIPFFIAVGFTYNPRRIVPGANDNLSGCYMGIALLREMEKNQVDLEHTEVGVVLTGSEEAGLRGAKAWCRKHAKDYQDVPTYILSVDTIHSPEYLMVNERDLNGTVQLDNDLSKVFLEAARKTGVPCRKGMIPLFGGATDSAAFTQGGFRSVSITAMSHRLENYYHTRRDTPENMNREGLDKCYQACVKAVELIDKGFLDCEEQ